MMQDTKISPKLRKCDSKINNYWLQNNNDNIREVVTITQTKIQDWTKIKNKN